MRIAIVDNLEPAMQAIRLSLATVPEYEIAWVARNGREAVERCAGDTPDLIIMDLVMPEMDGAEATRRIMAETPCAILVTSAAVGERAGKAFEAMGAGALDAVNTPSVSASGELVGGDRLLEKVATLGKLISTDDARSRHRRPQLALGRLVVPRPHRPHDIRSRFGGYCVHSHKSVTNRLWLVTQIKRSNNATSTKIVL